MSLFPPVCCEIVVTHFPKALGEFLTKLRNDWQMFRDCRKIRVLLRIVFDIE